MSHVDEGLLHAYVDGAFAPGDAEGAEIEAHLSSCADCRGRLEDVRGLKERAHEVLRHATPIDVRVPPFEALHTWKHGAPEAGTRALGVAAEPVSPRRFRRSPVRLAWAASVVLAIGAGWMANEIVRRDASEDAAVQTSTFSTGEARGARAEATRAEGGQLAASARRERIGQAATSADAASSGSGGARAAEQAADQSVAAEEGDSRERTGATPLAPVESAPPPATVAVTPTPPSDESAPPARAAEKLADHDAEREPMPAVADMLRREARAAAQLEALRVAPVPLAPRADMADGALTQTLFRTGDVVRLDTMPPALADGSVFAAHVALVNDYTAAVEAGLWSRATAEQAASALGREPARIGNLHAVETETAAVNGLVLVRQHYTLDDGTSLELIQRPTTVTSPSAEAMFLRDRAAALPQNGVPLKDLGASSVAFRGASAVALSRSGLVLLLKGPVPRDSLHGMATHIH